MVLTILSCLLMRRSKQITPQRLQSESVLVRSEDCSNLRRLPRTTTSCDWKSNYETSSPIWRPKTTSIPRSLNHEYTTKQPVSTDGRCTICDTIPSMSARSSLLLFSGYDIFKLSRSLQYMVSQPEDRVGLWQEVRMHVICG